MSKLRESLNDYLIKQRKTTYDKLSKELNRMNTKFFKQYYRKYGLSFCHVAFKYGIVSYYGDEDPEIDFEKLVK
ncbi:hypothetical protein [Mucilaginibacter sp. PAMB04168]|uniref:hypothetical protein n=1 Tax=Mucilaginibacter sp. PAMB04168 TaxID=3138567 RepID=UPI0031F6C83A